MKIFWETINWGRESQNSYLLTSLWPSQKVEFCQLPSWLCSQMKTQKRRLLVLLPKGKYPRMADATALLRAGLDPKAHCSVSVPHSFHSISGWCRFMVFLKGSNTKGQTSHLWKVMTIGLRNLLWRAWNVGVRLTCAESPSQSTTLLGNTEPRCGSMTSAPGGGSGYRKATTGVADQNWALNSMAKSGSAS